MQVENQKILIIGAGGQIGVELTAKLSEMYRSNVIASDLKNSTASSNNPFEELDALDKVKLFDIFKDQSRMFITCGLVVGHRRAKPNVCLEAEYGKFISCVGSCKGKTRFKGLLAKFYCRVWSCNTNETHLNIR